MLWKAMTSHCSWPSPWQLVLYQDHLGPRWWRWSSCSRGIKSPKHQPAACHAGPVEKTSIIALYLWNFVNLGGDFMFGDHVVFIRNMSTSKLKTLNSPIPIQHQNAQNPQARCEVRLVGDPSEVLCQGFIRNSSAFIHSIIQEDWMPAPSGYMWIGRNHENHSSKLPEMDWQLHDLHATGDNFKTYLIWSIWSDRAGCATRQVQLVTIRRWCRAPGQKRPQGIGLHLVMDRKTGGPLQKVFCTRWYVLDVWLVHSLIVSQSQY